jgi:tRNA(Ile)-lysidine synthase
MPAPALLARFAADWRALVGDAPARALVALSGGGDSVALLLLLHARLGDRCYAATVDHALRPESAAEARGAAALCAERGIAYAILTGPLPPRVGTTANLSTRARALRYAALEAHAAAIGADWIVTAHHADDQRETLLMRLGRGAGLAGLAGIRARNGRVVRPLLGWRRAELAAIVADAGIVPVADPTNHDDRFDRARLRKALATVDWLDVDGVARSARALAEAEAALDWVADRLLAERCVGEGAGLRLDLTGLPAELERRLTLLALARLVPESPPRGPALDRFRAALAQGKRAMLGAIVADAVGPVWYLRPAPPRRSH